MKPAATARSSSSRAAAAARAATARMTSPMTQQPQPQAVVRATTATGATAMDVQVLSPSAATANEQQLSPSSTSSDQAMQSGKLLLGQVRKHGFERPFARDQVISWTGHSISAGCFYVATISFLVQGESVDKPHGVTPLTLVALAIHVPTFLLLLAAWISCERIDPSKDVAESLPNGWLGVKLKGPRWEKARYCALCRKTVPGLDHHCTWLQTCVGRANYAQFFTIACTGAVQFLLQTLFAALCLAWLDLPFEPSSSMALATQGVLVALLLISVPCTLMYFILLGFHIWLAWLGYGTYEWMLRRRKQKSAARKARDAMAKKLSGAGDSFRDSSDSSGAGRPTSDSVVSTDSRHLSSVGSGSNFVSADGGSFRTRELTAL